MQMVKESIIFTAGGLIGAGVAWFLTKKYYRERTEKEIESVKEAYDRLKEDIQKRADAAKSKPDLSVYMEALKKSEEKAATPAPVNYSGFTSGTEEPDEPEPIEYVSTARPIDKEVDHSKPYLLDRMPYPNEKPYHSLITVIYYADGTYADQHGTEVEVEDYIGTDMMGYIEETSKDEIFIRNEELELDVDIIKDNRTYDDVMFG